VNLGDLYIHVLKDERIHGFHCDGEIPEAQSCRCTNGADSRRSVGQIGHIRDNLPYGLNLDPNADVYVNRQFATNHNTTIDHVERLPEKLPVLFASLTK